MSQDLVVVVSHTSEVLFLLLFTGAYFWYLLAFSGGARLLPPTQRLELLGAVQGRFLLVSWVFVGATLIGFLATLPSTVGLFSIVEWAIILIIVVSLSMVQFVFLRQVRRAKLVTLDSPDKSLKWKTSENTVIGIKAIRPIMAASVLNLALGIALIVLMALGG